MKKAFILSLVLTGILFSCSGKSGKTEEQQIVTEDTITVNNKEDNETVVKNFLTTLYSDYVFQYHDFSLIQNHFSEQVLHRLRQEYDYDGEGYAVWLFRSDAQDGPSDVSKVNTITPEPDGWYAVHYTDMGIKGTCHVLIQLRDGEPGVQDFK